MAYTRGERWPEIIYPFSNARASTFFPFLRGRIEGIQYVAQGEQFISCLNKPIDMYICDLTSTCFFLIQNVFTKNLLCSMFV